MPATRVSDGLPLGAACERTFNELTPFDGFAGAVAIDSKGNIFHIDSHPRMVFASFDGVHTDVFQ
jgi:L-asparaginase